MNIYKIISCLGQYEVRNWTLTAGYLPGNKKGLRLTVYLGRNLASILLVTYLPTVLMNLINQATNYIQSEDNYELVITVNITCMMVLASIYLSVSGSLPATAAIKTIEIWLLFNLTYPVMVIIVNVMLQIQVLLDTYSVHIILLNTQDARSVNSDTLHRVENNDKKEKKNSEDKIPLNVNHKIIQVAPVEFPPDTVEDECRAITDCFSRLRVTKLIAWYLNPAIYICFTVILPPHLFNSQ